MIHTHTTFELSEQQGRDKARMLGRDRERVHKRRVAVNISSIAGGSRYAASRNTSLICSFPPQDRAATLTARSAFLPYRQIFMGVRHDKRRDNENHRQGRRNCSGQGIAGDRHDMHAPELPQSATAGNSTAAASEHRAVRCRGLLPAGNHAALGTIYEYSTCGLPFTTRRWTLREFTVGSFTIPNVFYHHRFTTRADVRATAAGTRCTLGTPGSSCDSPSACRGGKENIAATV